MFDIEYKGGNTVVVATKKSTLVTDPKQSVIGLKDLVIKEAIELSTEDRFALNSASAALCIEGPGEYEISDFSIRGIGATRHIDTEKDEPIATIYRVEVSDVRIGIIGNIAGKLSEDQLEELGILDILIIPVGGNGYTLDANAAATITRQIDPKVVIPIHYDDKALKYEVPQNGVDEFVKDLGAPVEEMAKFKVKASSAIPQVLTIVQLTRS